MGRHVDKILLQEALENKGGKVAKLDINKSKEFKELAERVSNLEKAVEGLAEVLTKKAETKESKKSQ